jgi:CRISPR/Cas system CSM-associated protein Csm3 (group 7 of RAMP superfamily)
LQKKAKGKKRVDELTGPEAYRFSCQACRLFGNNALASRVRVGDSYLASEPAFEVRHGVAIDRVTGAVAQGPFEMELLTDGTLAGSVTVRNYTVGQFGLLAAALLDLADGLVPMGYGKSRGLGRLDVRFRKLSVRTLKDPAGRLLGAAFLTLAEQQKQYDLPPGGADHLELPGAAATRDRGYYVLASEGDTARAWLDAAAPRWVQEVSR